MDLYMKEPVWRVDTYAYGKTNLVRVTDLTSGKARSNTYVNSACLPVLKTMLMEAIEADVLRDFHLGSHEL